MNYYNWIHKMRKLKKIKFEKNSKHCTRKSIACFFGDENVTKLIWLYYLSCSLWLHFVWPVSLLLLLESTNWVSPTNRMLSFIFLGWKSARSFFTSGSQRLVVGDPQKYSIRRPIYYNHNTKTQLLATQTWVLVTQKWVATQLLRNTVLCNSNWFSVDLDNHGEVVFASV